MRIDDFSADAGSASSTPINRGRIRIPTNQRDSAPSRGCCVLP